ncbi:MAG TPA: ABC transporter permease [Pseudonocardiaceae bacterium]|nr:ABC transporter permease [Pseudonocardiaceae bacterium]
MLDALRYEIIRFRSLRSTWILLFAGLAMQFLIALIWAGHHDMTTDARFGQSFLGLFLVLAVLPCIAVAVNAFGHEYRYRTIIPTTLTLRTPGRILGAKAVVAAAAGAASGAALVAVTLLAETLGDGGPADAGLVGRVLLGAVLFGVLCSLAGLGVAALSRNGTIALIVMVVFPTIIEIGLEQAKVPASILPFWSAEVFLTSTGAGRWAQPLPLLIVVAVLLAASWLSLRRRDA